MAGSVRVEIDTKALGAVLKSSEVLSHLMGLGQSAAAAAGPGFVARPFYGFDRVSVIVAADSDEAFRAVQADSTVLTSALGAARG